MSSIIIVAFGYFVSELCPFDCNYMLILYIQILCMAYVDKQLKTIDETL